MALGDSLMSSLGQLQLQGYGTHRFGYGADALTASQRSFANKYATSALDQYNQALQPAMQTQQSLMSSPKINQNAISNISNLLGLGPEGTQGAIDALQATPGYQFALQSAMSSLQKRMGAQGLGMSGNFANAAQQNAMGLASQTYGQQLGYLQNFLTGQQQSQNAYNQLQTGKGELAAALQQQIGAAYASSAANLQ